MKKFISFIFLVMCVVHFTSGQISERSNDSTTYTFGTRPLKGTKAIAVGLNLNDTTFSNFKIGKQGLFLMGKYFISDRTAIRGSLRFNKDARTTTGSLIDTSVTNVSGQLSQEMKSSTREYAIMPGIERHFKPTNIFDVYVGTDALFGLRRKVEIENKNYTSNVYTNERSRTPETIFGINGLVGINFFVADLPLSIGLEYNWAVIWSLGGKTHVQRETRDALGNINEDDYYTEEKDAQSNPDPFAYNKLKRNSVMSNDSFRIMLNFYFR